MVELIVLVPGTPAVLLLMLVVLGWFEAAVAPAEAPDVEASVPPPAGPAMAVEPAPAEQAPKIAAGTVAVAPGEDAEHPRAA